MSCVASAVAACSGGPGLPKLPAVSGLIELEQKIEISITVSDQGLEKQLISGDVDFGFEFGRPSDPAIRFRSSAKHPVIAVATPEFVAERKVTNVIELSEHPFLFFTRLGQFRCWPPLFSIGPVFGRFNDAGLAREAALLGLGWSVLPKMTVEKELEEGKLVVIPGWQGQEAFGVWWTTGRDSLKPWVDWATHWLSLLQLEK